MRSEHIRDERAFADTLELPVVADPDLCADEAMPDTIPEPSIRRALHTVRRNGDLIIE